MTEEIKEKAENFIIDRYKLNECYREDNEETRGYMRMDVHSQYEEEYQLYLAGATEATKELQKELQWERETKSELAEHLGNANDKVLELEKKNKELLEELEKWKAEWQEQVQKATDEGYARTQLQIENGKLKEQNKELQEENEKLKKSNLEMLSFYEKKLNKNIDLEKQIEKMKSDSKTAYIKGIRTMANALKKYDRKEGAWTDYFEHTVDKVLKNLLKEFAK